MSISVSEIADDTDDDTQPSSSPDTEMGETLDSSQREEGRRDGESSVDLFLTAIEYTTDGGKPITHLFGRDENQQKHHVRVTGHRPHFFVKKSDYRANIENHYAVYDTERVSDVTLDDEELVKVYTYLPKQVADMRDMFEDTFEADVFYDNRFLIDQDIYTGFSIGSDRENPYPQTGEDGVVDFGTSASPRDSTSDVSRRHDVTVDEVQPCDPPDIDSRVLTTDIEVASERGVPDAGEANWPVSTIVAHDSYTDEYVGWLLSHERHDDMDESTVESAAELDEARLYDDETEMLHDFHEWVSSKSFDIFTGWFSNNFDYPYLVNRSKKKSVYAYQDWSPIGEVWITEFKGDKQPVINGAEPFDMLDGYDKTMRGEYQQGLDDVAEEELGYGKDEVEDGHTEMWKESPVKFLKYNKIDTQLVTEIEDAKGILELFRNIRKLTGAQLSDCHNPIDNLDVLYLREAQDRGLRLPTATANERSWFYGALVLEPQKGIHENVLYFDLASLYPNLIKMLNIGPDTILGYEKPDGVETNHSYVDERRVEVKKESEPETEKFYFADESDGTSFVADVVDDQLSLKEPYRGTDMYIAVKMQVNAQWGFLSDGDSYGTGSRLFNWRMGEAITQAERRILTFTKDRVLHHLREMGYEDVYATHGDSIPADEVVTVRSENEVVDVKRIEDIYGSDTTYEVWTEDGWTEINTVIQKPNRKQIYRVRTKTGVVHVTEDHSLLLPDGSEASPTEVSEGDEILHSTLNSTSSTSNSEDEYSNDMAWLLGLFVADGTAGSYKDVNGDSTTGWSISKMNTGLLKRAGEIIEREWDSLSVTTSVNDYTESSGCYKLRVSDLGEEKGTFVSWFRDKCYDGAEKQVPKEILNGDENVKEAFISGYLAGDGYDSTTSAIEGANEMSFRDRVLAHGIKTLLSDLGYTVTIDTRDNHDSEYYRIRLVSFHRGSGTEIESIDTIEYDGEYVYDLATENHHFHAGVGDIIVHNTDAAAVSVPSGDDQEQLIEDALEVAERVNEDYVDYVKETFDADENHMEVELESLASQLFIPRGATTDTPKKRYAQRVIWNDDDEWIDDPDVEVTGLEYVRSDTAKMTAQAQKKFVDILLSDDTTVGQAKEQFYDWLSDFVNNLRENEPHDLLGRPKGMQQPADEYGSPTHTPMPTYKGAKYANEYIYDGEAITSGDKPYMYYVDAVGGEYPVTYNSELDTKEAGTTVDAVSVSDPDDVPPEISVDVEKQIDRVLEPTISRLMDPVEWDFEEALLDSEQKDLSNYM